MQNELSSEIVTSQILDIMDIMSGESNGNGNANPERLKLYDVILAGVGDIQDES